MSANGSFGPVQVTVIQNATANNPFIYSIAGVIIGCGIGIVSGVVVDKVNSWHKRPERFLYCCRVKKWQHLLSLSIP
jgi:hypothetical protein